MFKTMKETFSRHKKVLCFGFIIYCIVHMYCLTNIITNHDDVAIRYYDNYDQTYLGRWLLYFINKITFYTLNTNWSVGVLCAVFVCISAMLIIEILSLNKNSTKIIAAFIILSFPTVTSWNLYNWMSLGFFLGFFLSVLSAFILYRAMNSENKFRIIIYTLTSAILLSLSLACYQAFACMFIVLVWYLVISQFFAENDNCKKPVIYMLYGIITFIVGYLIYRISLNLILEWKNMSLTGYQGISEMGSISIHGTLSGLKAAYVKFVEFYITGYDLKILKYLNFLVFLGLILMSGHMLYKAKKNIGTKVIIILLMLLMPLMVNSIYILTQGNSDVYSCMYITYMFPFLLFLVLAEHSCDKKLAMRFSVWIIGIVAFTFFMVDNRAYGNQDAVLNNIQQYFNRVAMRIESTEGFQENETRVYFSNPISLTEYPLFQESELDTTDSLQDIIYNDSGVHAFMNSFCAFHVKDIAGDDDLINAILESKEYSSMGVYPAESSIQFINGVLVVKFK